jgi:hypothetical protein
MDDIYSIEDLLHLSDDDVDTSVDDPESWQDFHTEHLLNMYTTITENYGLVCSRCPRTFNEFCTFMYNASTRACKEPFYITSDGWLPGVYDQLVSYCEIHDVPYMEGVEFKDFQNFIYYREL